MRIFNGIDELPELPFITAQRTSTTNFLLLIYWPRIYNLPGDEDDDCGTLYLLLTAWNSCAYDGSVLIWHASFASITFWQRIAAYSCRCVTRYAVALWLALIHPHRLVTSFHVVPVRAYCGWLLIWKTRGSNNNEWGLARVSWRHGSLLFCLSLCYSRCQ